MESIEIILSMIITIIGFITSTITYLIKYARAEKGKIQAQNTIELKDVMLDYIRDAEKLTNKTGEQKKQYVIGKMKTYADDNNLVFDEDTFTEVIDKIINLAKSINRPK